MLGISPFAGRFLSCDVCHIELESWPKRAEGASVLVNDPACDIGLKYLCCLSEAVLMVPGPSSIRNTRPTRRQDVCFGASAESCTWYLTWDWWVGYLRGHSTLHLPNGPRSSSPSALLCLTSSSYLRDILSNEWIATYRRAIADADESIIWVVTTLDRDP
jgi:hypothetical protein